MKNNPDQIGMEEQLPEDRKMIRRNKERVKLSAVIIYQSSIRRITTQADGKGAQYVQVNQIIGAVTEGKKIAEKTI